MKPSTLILAGGAAIAGFLFWRSRSSSSSSAPSSCTQRTSEGGTTAVARLLASTRRVFDCNGVSQVVGGRTTTAPVSPSPGILVAPSPKTLRTVVQTAPSSTSTSTRSQTPLSFNVTGKVAL